MKVYFVRHAETSFNAQGIHQPAEAPLSECGVRQAHTVGKKFLHLPIDVILTSPNVRAQETAKIISQYVDKPVVRLYHLRETRRPYQILGKQKDSPESKKISDLFYKNAENERWYFSDEENFLDLISRAKRVIKYISSRKEQRILVVTHSTFLKLIICSMMLGPGLTPETFKSFIKFFSTKNTGITLCQRRESGNWRLVTWNDYTHLRSIKQSSEDGCSRE